ncbi:hypothetical protein CLOP_g1817 [Closterium sp. NIES-67]|nr:hypothetical protein CLOP_g1817 [Closterium sp. NIES-67]
MATMLYSFVCHCSCYSFTLTLKTLLLLPPVLRIANPERPFEVIIDASDIAIGAVLMLDFGNGLQPIAYESRKIQSAERNYPLHDKEMLTIVHAFKIWRCYLTGADVTRDGSNSGPKLSSTLRITNSRSPQFEFYQDISGFDKTLKTLQRFYYWPDMVTDVQRYVAVCSIMPANEIITSATDRTVAALEPPQRPWQLVTMDFVTGLTVRIERKRRTTGCRRQIDENGAFRTMSYNHHRRRNRATIHLDRCSAYTRDTSSNH